MCILIVMIRLVYPLIGELLVVGTIDKGILFSVYCEQKWQTWLYCVLYVIYWKAESYFGWHEKRK